MGVIGSDQCYNKKESENGSSSLLPRYGVVVQCALREAAFMRKKRLRYNETDKGT